MADDPLYEIVKIVIACVLLWNAVSGMRTGTARLVYRQVSRENEAGLFWAAVIISALLGAWLTVASIFPAVEKV